MDIYYFSGTGNSLVVARDIAGELSARLTPIASLTATEAITAPADAVGFVFPVYLGGIPRIVARFVRRMDNLESIYVFAVCTFENTTGAVFKILSRAVERRGGRLSAGFAVKMPGNYIVGGEPISREKQQVLFEKWNEELSEVVQYVKEKRVGLIEKCSEGGSRLGNAILSSVFVNRLLSWMYLARDKNFYTTDSCNGCGICARLCPAGNIEMIGSKPSWLHHCEQCFACLHWCPKEAIQYRIHAPFVQPGGPQANMTENRRRYRHPEVKLADIVGQKILGE